MELYKLWSICRNEGLTLTVRFLIAAITAHIDASQFVIKIPKSGHFIKHHKSQFLSWLCSVHYPC